MVQNQALYNGLGVDDMIKVLMNKTWQAPRLKALPGLILQQNEQLLLTYLLGVSTNDELSFAAHAAITKATNDIEKLTRKQLLTAPASAQGYLLLTLDRIKNRLDAKPYMPEQMPPGAPIGCGEE